MVEDARARLQRVEVEDLDAELAAGALVVDIRPDVNRREEGTLPGAVVIDRNVVKPGTRTRVAEAVEQALDLGRGVMHIGYVDADKDETKWKVEKYSQHLACEHCNLSFEPLNPHN